MSTWRELIEQTMEENGDDWSNVVEYKLAKNTWEEGDQTLLPPEELDRDFHCSYGGTEGAFFTLWSREFVYFPICYDGAEWCGSAPRNPCNVALEHQGG